MRTSNIMWLRELPLSIVTTANTKVTLAEVPTSDRVALYEDVEAFMACSENKELFPMCWRTAAVPSQYVLTIIVYHLLYQSISVEAYIQSMSGSSSRVHADPEQLDASMKPGNQIEVTLQYKAFRQNTAKQMASLASPECVWDVNCRRECFKETVNHLQQPSKRRSTKRNAVVMRQLMAHIWHPSRMLKLQQAEHDEYWPEVFL